MNPYRYVREAVEDGSTLLSLCVGIGLELNNLNAKSIMGVDIAPQYIEALKRNHAGIVAVLSDVTEFIQEAPDNSFDVISFIDGLEHLSKEDGLIVLKECKRVAKKEIIVFTQIGYLKNEPHNAWGIEGADEYQRHKSGWEVEELAELGYRLIEKSEEISQHGEQYTAVLYKCFL